MVLMSAGLGGSTLLTKMKMAFSGVSLMRLRITCTNWPTGTVTQNVTHTHTQTDARTHELDALADDVQKVGVTW